MNTGPRAVACELSGGASPRSACELSGGAAMALRRLDRWCNYAGVVVLLDPVQTWTQRWDLDIGLVTAHREQDLDRLRPITFHHLHRNMRFRFSLLLGTKITFFFSWFCPLCLALLSIISPLVAVFPFFSFVALVPKMIWTDELLQEGW
jgi:hypothetical protein